MKKLLSLRSQKLFSRLRFADDVIDWGLPKNEAVHRTLPEDEVLLRLPIDEADHWRIGVRVEAEPLPGRTYPASERTLKAISVQRFEEIYGRDGVEYRLGADNVVRRWDSGDVYAEGQREKELGLGPKLSTSHMPDDVVSQIRKALSDELDEAVPNMRLEQKMGYQLQLVGLEELDGLIDFLSQPGIVPHRFPKY